MDETLMERHWIEIERTYTYQSLAIMRSKLPEIFETFS